jgi:hypothetical protein
LYVCLDYNGQEIKEIKDFSILLHNIHFLVSNDYGDLELLTFFYFTPPDCEDTKSSRTQVINKFSSKTKKWENNEKFPRKFRDFNACPLFATVPLLHPFTHLIEFNDGTVIWDGIYIRIAKMLSWKLNYRAEYELAQIDTVAHLYMYDERYHFLMEMKNVDEKMMIVGDYRTIRFHTDPVVLTEWKIFVSPPELYSIFERLFLPFDEPTWTYLIITVVIGLVVIFLVNFTKKAWQNFVYGRGVETPTLNLM